MKNFLAALKTQRWDDHRYYHHSRINQTLHLVSALSFLTAYVLIFSDPAAAALIGWLSRWWLRRQLRRHARVDIASKIAWYQRDGRK